MVVRGLLHSGITPGGAYRELYKVPGIQHGSAMCKANYNIALSPNLLSVSMDKLILRIFPKCNQ